VCCPRDEEVIGQNTIFHCFSSRSQSIPQLSTLRRLKSSAMAIRPTPKNNCGSNPYRIPDATIALHEAQRKKKAAKQRACADRFARNRAILKPGQAVIAQHMITKRWDQRATIVEVRENGRSFTIAINGSTFLRNRRFLRPNILPDQINQRTTPKLNEDTTRDIAANPKKRGRPKGKTKTKSEEPRNTYSQRIRRQREHYQASKPKRGCQN
jgi:hypothetical protein